jgi:hypothetical protein
MARSDTEGLTEKEQRELLRLLEEDQENTLILIHSIPVRITQGRRRR